MLKVKNIYFKLSLASLLAVISIHSGNNFASQVSAQELVPASDSTTIIAKKSRSSNTRKSGGRSSGGSFKNRSKPRSSGSRSRPSSRNNNDNYNNRNNDYDSTPTYNNRRDSSGNNSTSSSRSYSNTPTRMSRTVGFIVIGFTLIAIGGIIFIPLFFVLKLLMNHFNWDNREARQTQKEIDNNKVTVSKIQVALSGNAFGIQQDLSELSMTANTETSEGLLKLMRDASLIVVRNSEAWTHVLSSSVSMNIDKAESAFDSLSLVERSKYSSETLSNVDGDIRRLKKQFNNNQDNFAEYVVVTLIFGTVDDKPLFEKINTKEQLEAVLLKLAAMREDYLIKFELLWSPQTEGIYLTDEELLMQYTDMIPLV